MASKDRGRFTNDWGTSDGNRPRLRFRRRKANGTEERPREVELSELAEITKYVDHHANLKWEVKSAEQGRVE